MEHLVDAYFESLKNQEKFDDFEKIEQQQYAAFLASLPLEKQAHYHLYYSPVLKRLLVPYH